MATKKKKTAPKLKPKKRELFVHDERPLISELERSFMKPPTRALVRWAASQDTLFVQVQDPVNICAKNIPFTANPLDFAQRVADFMCEAHQRLAKEAVR